MSIIAQTELALPAIPLQTLADALAARTALARSLPDDLVSVDCAPFAQVDAQVGAQLEASAAQLAIESGAVVSEHHALVAVMQ